MNTGYRNLLLVLKPQDVQTQPNSSIVNSTSWVFTLFADHLFGIRGVESLHVRGSLKAAFFVYENRCNCHRPRTPLC